MLWGMDIKTLIKDSLVTILGTFILAVGVSFFILPYNILSGGVAGIAIALKPIFHLPETLVINVLVYGLFIVGCFFLGKDFALKTVISSVVYPPMINMLNSIDYSLDISPIIASLYGGLICGFGIGIVMRVDASTGGMDIPALILHKLTGVNTSTYILIIDTLSVLLGLFAYGLEAILVGMIAVVSSSWIIDKTLTFGGTSAKAIQIISDHWEAINQRITTELERGTTLIDATGGYTSAPKKIILVVIDKKEYPRLLEIVDEIDRRAFMITTETQDVHGEGFKLEFRI